MTMTDPIADMLTRLRNANQAYHDKVTMPFSKIKANIAEVLKAEGYIASWSAEEPEEGAVGKRLVVELKYGHSRERRYGGRAPTAHRHSGPRRRKSNYHAMPRLNACPRFGRSSIKSRFLD